MIGNIVAAEKIRVVRIGDYVDLAKWDIASPLREEERRALRLRGRERANRLERFVAPLQEAQERIFLGSNWDVLQTGLLLDVMREIDSSYWLWTDEEWSRAMGILHAKRGGHGAHVVVLPMLLAPSGLQAIKMSVVAAVAPAFAVNALFGERFYSLAERVEEVAVGLGYSSNRLQKKIREGCLGRIVLLAGTTELTVAHEGMAQALFSKVHKGMATGFRTVGTVLCQMGVFADKTKFSRFYGRSLRLSLPGGWQTELDFWEHNQTRLQPAPARHQRDLLRSIARWFAVNMPEVSGPAELTVEKAIRYRTACINAKHGDFRSDGTVRSEELLSTRTRGRLIVSVGKFINDLVDLRRLPENRRLVAFELRKPSYFSKHESDNPRVIEDLAFAKLLQAGVELTPEDTKNTRYPHEMIKAMAVVWLWCGMRSNEIRRLGLHCIEKRAIPGDEERELLYLNVPVNKYQAEFAKPVTGEIADALQAWLDVRPKGQPAVIDPKTGRYEEKLFSMRGQLVSETYVNTVVRLVARKAGLERYRDAHGGITSHRMRATMATHLGSGENGMSLAALKEWLGHRKLSSTMAYFKVTKEELARQYRKAHKVGVKVYLDLNVIQSQRIRSEPFRFAEVAQGLCGYTPFASCPNNMGCLQDACEHYYPDGSETAERVRSGEGIQELMEFVMSQPIEIKRRKRGEPRKLNSKI